MITLSALADNAIIAPHGNMIVRSREFSSLPDSNASANFPPVYFLPFIVTVFCVFIFFM
jgi:hypothetical protein